MNVKLISILILLCLSSACFAESLTGLEQVRAMKKDLWDSRDTEWTKWMVVSVAPTRIYFDSWPDERRQQFFEDFDPDHLDMWSGQGMDRGSFFRMRGVAVNSTMEYEYQELINPVYGHAEIFKNNGIARKEDGSIAGRYFKPGVSPPCMCHNAPLWHEVVTQGMVRTAAFGDSVFQDNIANPIYTWSHGFCNWCNTRFIEYMKERFTGVQLRRMGFDPGNFHIRRYIAAQRRKAGEILKSMDQQFFQEEYTSKTANDRLLKDELIREYIRFQHIVFLKHWVDAATKAKDTARKMGKSIPACYGNIPRIGGIRTFPTIMASQVDIPWSEESTDMQPCFRDDRQAWSALLYKTGRAASFNDKPVITVQYQGGHKSIYDDPGRKKLPTAITCSEAVANGGILCQTWVATEFTYLMKNPGWDKPFYEANSTHSSFASKNRVLFTDRKAIADVALVYSFPTTFWRTFQSLKVETPHKDAFGAVARVLEDNHVPYDIMLFGHKDVFDDSYFFERINKYKTIILPNVDCLSNKNENKIADWVRQGGNLVLLGNTGIYDEELNIRRNKAFNKLPGDAGSGTVTSFDFEEMVNLTFGEDILPASKIKPREWNYTFEKPAENWYGKTFNDSKWERGKAPFGDRKIRGTDIKTKWETKEIWLRCDFELNEVPDNPLLYLQHWWDVEVYINGIEAATGSGRGYSFEAYQYLAIDEKAMKALKKGKNTIAVHCTQSHEHPTWGRFIDVGIRDLSPDDRLVKAVHSERQPLIETDLPKTVWLNPWRHGGGDMTSIQMVNYDVDLKNDKMNPVDNFFIKLKKQGRAEYDSAYYYFNDFDGKKVFEPVKIPVEDAGDYWKVKVPSLNVFGAVVLAPDDELKARTAAAEVRKYLERLKISQRCRGAEKKNNDLISNAENLLSKIQGDAKVWNYDMLTWQLEKAAGELESALNNSIDSVEGYQKDLRKQAYMVDAEYKFDFGSSDKPQGWLPVTPQTLYSRDTGYGWVEKGPFEAIDYDIPDDLHDDFIKNTGPDVRYEKAEPDTYTGKFKVDLDNGKYFVTIITGNHEVFRVRGTHNEGRTSMTFVKANGELKALGDTLLSGYFDNKGFIVDVTGGQLLLEFYGKNIGPLYANRIQWLVNGILIQKAGQKPTKQASEYYERNQLYREAAIKQWQIAGPVNDEQCIKMTEAIDAKNISGWQQWKYNGNGFPLVSFEDISPDFYRAIAHAKTYIHSEDRQEAFILGSFSQLGRINLNGKEIYADHLAAGLLDEEIKSKITLEKGWNEIMLKCSNYWGKDWSFWLGLTSLQNEPLTDIKISSDRQG